MMSTLFNIYSLTVNEVVVLNCLQHGYIGTGIDGILIASNMPNCNHPTILQIDQAIRIRNCLMIVAQCICKFINNSFQVRQHKANTRYQVKTRAFLDKVKRFDGEMNGSILQSQRIFAWVFVIRMFRSDSWWLLFGMTVGE